MSFVEIFVKIFFFHLSVFIIPGPNLLLVIKNSMAGGVKNGLFTSLGICFGISLHIFYTLFFLSSLSKETLLELENLKYLAGIYLVYMAWLGFINSRKIELDKDNSKTLTTYFSSLKNGFLIDSLNPLISVFYFLLWTSIILTDLSLVNIIIYGVFSLILILIWFFLISFIFSRNNLMTIYLNYSTFIERCASIMLVIFASLLFLS